MLELFGCILISIIGISFIAMTIDELITNHEIRKDMRSKNDK